MSRAGVHCNPHRIMNIDYACHYKVQFLVRCCWSWECVARNYLHEIVVFALSSHDSRGLHSAARTGFLHIPHSGCHWINYKHKRVRTCLLAGMNVLVDNLQLSDCFVIIAKVKTIDSLLYCAGLMKIILSVSNIYERNYTTFLSSTPSISIM